MDGGLEAKIHEGGKLTILNFILGAFRRRCVAVAVALALASLRFLSAFFSSPHMRGSYVAHNRYWVALDLSEGTGPALHRVALRCGCVHHIVRPKSVRPAVEPRVYDTCRIALQQLCGVETAR